MSCNHLHNCCCLCFWKRQLSKTTYCQSVESNDNNNVYIYICIYIPYWLVSLLGLTSYGSLLGLWQVTAQAPSLQEDMRRRLVAEGRISEAPRHKYKKIRPNRITASAHKYTKKHRSPLSKRFATLGWNWSGFAMPNAVQVLGFQHVFDS